MTLKTPTDIHGNPEANSVGTAHDSESTLVEKLKLGHPLLWSPVDSDGEDSGDDNNDIMHDSTELQSDVPMVSERETCSPLSHDAPDPNDVYEADPASRKRRYNLVETYAQQTKSRPSEASPKEDVL